MKSALSSCLVWLLLLAGVALFCRCVPVLRPPEPGAQEKRAQPQGPAAGLREYERWATERAWRHTGRERSRVLFGYTVESIQVVGEPDPTPPSWMESFAPRSFRFRPKKLQVTASQYSLFDPIDDRDQCFADLEGALGQEIGAGAELLVTWKPGRGAAPVQWLLKKGQLTVLPRTSAKRI